MSLTIRRTQVQLEFRSSETARLFVDRCRNAGLQGKARLTGTGQDKVRLYRGGAFDLAALTRALEEAGLADGLEDVGRVRLIFEA